MKKYNVEVSMKNANKIIEMEVIAKNIKSAEKMARNKIHVPSQIVSVKAIELGNW